MAIQGSPLAQVLAYQIPRNSLALLMVAQLVVLAPLVIHVSPWIVGVYLVCGLWRWQVYVGRWNYPVGAVKSLLVIAAVVGLFFSGFQSYSLEAGTSLLVLAFALKLLEMKKYRDAYLVIYLSYFLIAIAFLFDQSLLLTCYAMFSLIVVTAAMVGMNQRQAKVRPAASLRLAAILIGQAIPLTLVLFLLFPRAAPLWSIPLPSAATTGISDRLTPGDIANLIQSDDIAFRVMFEGNVPPQRELYWRGLVYSQFADGTWTMNKNAKPQVSLGRQGRGTAYDVFLEPTQSKWLFTLDTPVEYGRRQQLLSDFRLVNADPVLSVLRYRIVSDATKILDPSIDDALRASETVLPAKDNPGLRAYATEIYERSGRNASLMANVLLTEIRKSPFHYTLKPPQLSPINSIDEFWFDQQKGFCTHYAGAFVFALRAVGIPARVVGGYQGGEINPVTGHFVVRQFDAHAWAEVWLEGSGWTRYDPTNAVAPARVERGLRAALSNSDRTSLSFLTVARLDDQSLFGSTLKFIDSLEHLWNLSVVGYDVAAQADLLTKLLGRVTPVRVGLALFVGGVISVLLVVGVLFFRRRHAARNAAEQVFQNFCAQLARQGYDRAIHETPAEYISRLGTIAQINPKPLILQLHAHLYDPEFESNRKALSELRKEFRKLRFKLAFSTTVQAS